MDAEATAKPWFKKKRFVIPMAIALLIGLANIAPKSDDTTGATDTSVSQDQNSSTDLNDTPAVIDPAPVEDPGPVETVSQENARLSAAGYVESMAFSRTGLIKQLVFEGFSEEDATYGVDANSIDWMDQAAKSAAAYLESMPFSRQSLIDQLEYEGFTKKQAAYGVSTTGL